MIWRRGREVSRHYAVIPNNALMNRKLSQFERSGRLCPCVSLITSSYSRLISAIAALSTIVSSHVTWQEQPLPPASRLPRSCNILPTSLTRHLPTTPMDQQLPRRLWLTANQMPCSAKERFGHAHRGELGARGLYRQHDKYPSEW